MIRNLIEKNLGHDKSEHWIDSQNSNSKKKIKIFYTYITRINVISELSKTIGPVGRADENLSGPIVSSKTSVQMTDWKNRVW